MGYYTLETRKTVSKKLNKNFEKKGSEKNLRELIKKKKNENPYRRFSRDPRPDDLKFKNWQKEANRNLQLDEFKGNPKRACYLAISLSTSSSFKNRPDDNYATNHESMLGAISNALLCNCIPPDLSDPSTDEFRQHLISQYAHDNAESQFQYAWGTALKSTQEDLIKNLESSNEKGDYGYLKKVDFDIELLDRYERTEISEFTKISPVPDDELKKLDPLEIVQQLFPDHVLNYAQGGAKNAKMGYICTQEVEQMLGVIFNPHTDHPKQPWPNGDFYEDLSTMRYISRSIFKEPSSEGGGRKKDNIAKEHLAVFECDFLLQNGDVDHERIEKFSTFMMILRKYAPLVYVCYSGGKSYHFAFALNDISKEDYKEINAEAVQHGADRSVIKDKTKLVRMPNVEPDPKTNRKYQSLLYFDPEQVNPIMARQWDIIGFHQEINEKKKINIWHKDTAFYFEDANRRWVKTGSIEDYLAKIGFSKECMIGERLPPSKEKKLEIENNRSVNEVIDRLGGYDSGIVEFSGVRILIRSNRVMPPISEQSGEVKETLNFTRELFKSDISYHVFLGWLSDAFKNYYNDGKRQAKITPSQMMHIVGENNSGKTAYCEVVLKPLFGGSATDGSDLFIRKDTHFNSNEQASALLIMDDKNSDLGTSDRDRDYQSEIIKSITVSGTETLHAKGADKIDVVTYKRALRLLNYNKIPTLPMVNEPSVADKVIILKACSNDNRSQDWFDKIKKNINRELPFFTRFLLDYECPAEYQPPKNKRRFPVISYHDPEIVMQLNEGSKTEQLQEIINQGNLDVNNERNGVNVYEGTSSQIYNELRGNLRGDELDRFKKMFSSPDKLLHALRELRLIGQNENNQKIFYSSKDDLEPEFINDGHRYWRVIVNRKEQTSLEKKFFGKSKETPKKAKKKLKFGK